jgi:hypothetical protein
MIQSGRFSLYNTDIIHLQSSSPRLPFCSSPLFSFLPSPWKNTIPHASLTHSRKRPPKPQSPKSMHKRIRHYQALPPRASHLTIPAALPRRIIRLQHSGLAFVRLREGVAALFAHTLHLPHFADCFLELFHSVVWYTLALMLERKSNKRPMVRNIKGMVNEMARGKKSDNIPRSIILNVILLNLLHMMVRLRPVHPFIILPRKVSYQTQRR